MAKEESAITPTRAEDYAEWYQQVIKAAGLAEVSSVRGCMVIQPWGYGIWENLQRELDTRFKATGHENAYFPLFIPLSLLQKEADHVEGFAKECAVVTHHRLEVKDGKLVPAAAAELEEPLIVRPTSETIIGESFSKWVQSYRDLPILINQWANVVRWEMRTRMFLRTAEFLWQEGHTVHADLEDAMRETMRMLEVYRDVAENVIALPVIPGEKSAGERFPGAVRSFCIEAMMQDRKALQAGTSHYLGQNFAKSSNIKFLDQAGAEQYAHTTSWGVSTRLIGAMIMAHSDDDGLRIPPKLAPKHVVILPITPKPESTEAVLKYSDDLAEMLRKVQYNGAPLVVHVDKRDIRGGEKSWQWIKKGIPIRIEVGPKDLESDSVMVANRSVSPRDKQKIARTALGEKIVPLLEQIHSSYFTRAKEELTKNTVDGINNFEELTHFLTPKNEAKPEIHGGFVRGKWCNAPACEEKLTALKASIRCIPFDQRGGAGKCIICGGKGEVDVIIGKAY